VNHVYDNAYLKALPNFHKLIANFFIVVVLPFLLMHT